MKPEIEQAIEAAITKALGAQVDRGRYLDVSRIPLICQNINVIHDDIKEIKTVLKDQAKSYVTHEQFEPVQKNYVTQDQFSPVQKIVFGVVALILTSVVGAMIAMVVIE